MTCQGMQRSIQHPVILLLKSSVSSIKLSSSAINCFWVGGLPACMPPLSWPAGGQLSCYVRLHNKGNVGLKEVQVVTPVGATNCTAPALEPGADLTCSATVIVPQDSFEAGNVTLKVKGQAVNRADRASVVSDQAEKTMQLTQTPSMSVSITLASPQTAVFTHPGGLPTNTTVRYISITAT